MAIKYLKRGKPAAERGEDAAKVRAVVEATLKDIEVRGDRADHPLERDPKDPMRRPFALFGDGAVREDRTDQEKEQKRRRSRAARRKESSHAARLPHRGPSLS